MNWSSESRQSFLRGVDAVEGVVVAFYRMLLALVVVAILAAVGYVAVQKPFGAGNQGEYFYFGLAVLIALGWASGQFVALGWRRSRTRPDVKVGSSAQDGAYTWQFELGTPPSKVTSDASGNGVQYSFSRDFRIPLKSLPTGVVPDEAKEGDIRSAGVVGSEDPTTT